MSHISEHRHDPEAFQKGYLFGNDFAKPYMSNWSIIHDQFRDRVMHMNCSYLSTHGQPPTLLALKQHAQSLAILISFLCPTLQPTEINGPGMQRGDAANHARVNDAFDWITDLAVPYWNDDPNHHKPLNALLNEVRSAHDVLGTQYHCPLAEAPKPRKPGQAARPYASHHRLLMHANECLERLDHEFSATGGLLSVLPSEGAGGHSAREVEAARNSLVGQWLQFTGHLVGRMHELEIAYGNCLDALASEAAVPVQHMSRLGPDGRSGREIAFPQDRWVLANAGDDVFDHLHDLFDRDEALIEEKERIYRGKGAATERLWAEKRGGGDYARGIVPVHVNTRYFRIKGQGRGTIFVVPAWDNHPGVEHTRRMERRPTVVSVVQPKFPQRVTELERRYDERLERAGEAELENLKLRQATMKRETGMQVLQDELERQRAVADALAEEAGRPRSELVAQLTGEKQRAEALEKEVAALKEKLQGEEKRLQNALIQQYTVMGERNGLKEQIEKLGYQVSEEGWKVAAQPST
ncbi:hypothetical protein NKR23_g9839 [Pleurostoma richardsiae]|uniref:Uncharacterized protein n=1 Tax=Pleurostoma richardsiae TaxID=41990 RepID=A0AA38REI6_9PEZI|nr:hypothetical protein NKR23_g9839 [Pleurostoma richardsiae]